MLLIDSSVWIESFRRKPAVDLDALAGKEDLAICLPILQEVLQGTRAEMYARVRRTLQAARIVESPLRLALFEEAIDLYRAARRAGATIRSGTDCLIAACAIRHDYEVLHRDRDYPALAKVSALRQRAV